MKCVLHIGKTFGYIPTGHSTMIKENHNKIRFVLKKFYITNTSGSLVSIWKWLGFSLGYKVVIQSSHVFYAFGIAEQDPNIGIQKDYPVKEKMAPSVKKQSSSPSYWKI